VEGLKDASLLRNVCGGPEFWPYIMLDYRRILVNFGPGEPIGIFQTTGGLKLRWDFYSQIPCSVNHSL
jgi:hypothetical protein